MENERVRKTKNDIKKKQCNNWVLLSSNMISKNGGNGIAGLLVLGGAMAVAGYVAVLSLHSFVTNRKTKAMEKSKSSVTENEPKAQQLSLEDCCKSQDYGVDDHYQTQTTPNSDGDAVSACHVTSHMNINKPLILEEEDETVSDLVIPNNFHQQEIVLYDDSHPESVASSSSNENEIVEEDGPEQNLDSMQTETKDDDDEYDNNNNMVVKESEKDENSSKETEGVSMNYSNEDKGEQDLKECEGTKESDTQTHEAAEKMDNAVRTNMTMNVKAKLSEGLKYQQSPSYSFQLITWLMPKLLQVLVLVLVLFTCTSLFISSTK